MHHPAATTAGGFFVLFRAAALAGIRGTAGGLLRMSAAGLVFAAVIKAAFPLIRFHAGLRLIPTTGFAISFCAARVRIFIFAVGAFRRVPHARWCFF